MNRLRLLFTVLIVSGWTTSAYGQLSDSPPSSDTASPQTSPKRNKGRWSQYSGMDAGLPGIIFIPTGLSIGVAWGWKYSMPDLENQLILGSNLNFAHSLTPGTRAGTSVEWRRFPSKKDKEKRRSKDSSYEWSGYSYGFGLHAGFYPMLMSILLSTTEDMEEREHLQFGAFATFRLYKWTVLFVECNPTSLVTRIGLFTDFRAWR